MQIYKTFDITKEEIVPLAERMKKEGRRLLMIHGYVDKEGNNVVSYQFDMGETVEAYVIKGANNIPSISSIYDVQASWPEEEIHELMGINFEGLNMRGRLFLPETMIDGKGQIIVTPLNELRKKTKVEKE